MRREERLSLMKAWRKSGITKKAYCERKKLNYGTFISWFQEEKRRKKRLAKEEEIVKVGEESSSVNTLNTGEFICIESSNPTVGAVIRLPNGIEVQVEHLNLELLKILTHV